jgi:hypothetical protein
MLVDVRIVKVWFWLQLAILLGVGMNLSTDANGQKLVQEKTYNYSEADQGFVVSDRGTFTSDHIKLLRLLSAQSPKVASQVTGVLELINDCVWAAERTVAR